MNAIAKGRKKNPLAALGKLARGGVASDEQCDFCSLPLGPVHRHLIETATRKIICVCDACGLRFHSAVGRYKLIPRDARVLPGFQITDEQWAGLGLPINLAFIFRSSAHSHAVALYPSPAGATESVLRLESWDELAAANPALAGLESDTQALLVNRIGEKREYYLAPIDLCFELVGLIRVHWRGFSGGDKVWQEIDGFFCRLRAQAAPPLQTTTEAAHA